MCDLNSSTIVGILVVLPLEGSTSQLAQCSYSKNISENLFFFFDFK